jgi:hypothetical protein
VIREGKSISAALSGRVVVESDEVTPGVECTFVQSSVMSLKRMPWKGGYAEYNPRGKLRRDHECARCISFGRSKKDAELTIWRHFCTLWTLVSNVEGNLGAGLNDTDVLLRGIPGSSLFTSET